VHASNYCWTALSILFLDDSEAGIPQEDALLTPFFHSASEVIFVRLLSPLLYFVTRMRYHIITGESSGGCNRVPDEC
jgi:hypothetical protein